MARGDEMKHKHSEEEERRIREAALDETIAESFPASDPPSTVPNPDEAPTKEREGRTDDRAGGVPEERDDPRRHGDKLEEAIRPRSGPERGGAGPAASTGTDRQRPTPGSAESERDVDGQDQ
jgi:hypothetical protein